MEELKKRGINPHESEAIVHAGEEEGYERMVSDLKKRGIKIRFANRDPGGLCRIRDITYDPVSDEMTVEGVFGKEFYTAEGVLKRPSDGHR